MTPNRPTTDIHEIINKEVANHMKPFVEANMSEHEQTRQQFKKLEKVVCKMNAINIHDVIQYAAITALSLFVILFLTGC